jgi:1-deoxy-D-xylulose-5-phosphate reductoisomerase
MAVTKTRGIVVLGSTGSIGTQTLDVVRAFRDRFTISGLSAGTNAELLAQQVGEFRVPFAACAVPGAPLGGARRATMEELVELPDVDLVVVATTSTSALRATLRALELGRDVATANKEVLVAAGELVVAAARRHGARLLPIDSEHNAIWQCLRGEGAHEVAAGDTVARIVLTASGGAFRDRPLEELARVTPAEALRHPVWQMGAKITIDSATLANKAFEVIEARWLFDVPYERIFVVLHRESVVHSIVQFVDGSSKAQLALPDMRLPIQYALTYPERVPGPVGQLDLTTLGSLTFGPVDERRYPAFGLIREAGRKGGTYPAVVSAANDVAVEQFVGGAASFPKIAETLAAALNTHVPTTSPALDDVLAAEDWARSFARDRLDARGVAGR